MRRIGTTSEGGCLVEISRSELATLQQAGDLLSEVAACVLLDGLAPESTRAATPKAQKPVKVSILPARGQIKCTVCGVTKPATDFYAKAKQCKRCIPDRQKAAKLAKAGKGDHRAARKAEGLAVVNRVASELKKGRTFLLRPRDPDLDRPVDGSGKVQRVGGEA